MILHGGGQPSTPVTQQQRRVIATWMRRLIRPPGSVYGYRIRDRGDSQERRRGQEAGMDARVCASTRFTGIRPQDRGIGRRPDPRRRDTPGFQLPP